MRRTPSHGLRPAALKCRRKEFRIRIRIISSMMVWMLLLLLLHISSLRMYSSLHFARVEAFLSLLTSTPARFTRSSDAARRSTFSLNSDATAVYSKARRQTHQATSNRSTSHRKLPVVNDRRESLEWMIRQLDQLPKAGDVDERMLGYCQGNGSSPSTPLWMSWTVRDQLQMIKYLGRRRASKGILEFVDTLGNSSTSNSSSSTSLLVKLYTSALFAMAQGTPEESGDSHTSALAWSVLDRMKKLNIQPTSLTLVGLLSNIRDGPAAVLNALLRLEGKFPTAPWDVEVYHTAIRACRVSRESQQSGSSNYKDGTKQNNWQVAIQLMQQMQRKHRLQPTAATYLAVLQVLSESGKTPMVRSVVRQWRKSNAETNEEHASNDRIWATAMIACARVGDYRLATEFLHEMDTPNLRHCTSLLMALANANEHELAVDALNLMTGAKTGSFSYPGCTQPLTLPLINPDMVALNTVISAAAKTGNYDAARELFERIQSGEFIDPNQDDDASTRKPLSPDRITYHNLLLSCKDPIAAKDIVKEMRLSRRYRFGAIPPTNVTYAHAIRVCLRSEKPDLEVANVLLEWAKDDRVEPTPFMYGPAIWIAQRCGETDRCIQLYEEMRRNGCPVDDLAVNGALSAVAISQDEEQTLRMFDELKDKGFSMYETSLKRLVYAIQSNTTASNTDKEEKLLHILDRLSAAEKQATVGSAVFEALITLYGSRGNADEALMIANQIKGCWDAPCLRAMLRAYASCPEDRYREAIDLLHTSDIVEGASGPALIDQLALSHVLVACSKANQFDEGLSLLQLYGLSVERLPIGAPSMTVGSINALIASAGRGGCPEISLAILNDMKFRFGIHPDTRSYRSALIACNQAQHANKIYGEEADESYDEDRDDGPYLEWWEIALSLLERMKRDGLTPDVQIYSSVISACESAGQWQRALGILQNLIEDHESSNGESSNGESSSLNLYCWNAAISACEKGGAWVEALDLYERMLETESIKPNVVTLNSLLEALEGHGQRELAQTKYVEGFEMRIVNPWRKTTSAKGDPILALDFHKFSSAMTKVALRHVLDTWLDESDITGGIGGELVIVTGKGLKSAAEPVLRKTVAQVLQEYGIEGTVDETNAGRTVIDVENLLECFDSRSWR